MDDEPDLSRRCSPALHPRPRLRPRPSGRLISRKRTSLFKQQQQQQFDVVKLGAELRDNIYINHSEEIACHRGEEGAKLASCDRLNYRGLGERCRLSSDNQEQDLVYDLREAQDTITCPKATRRRSRGRRPNGLISANLFEETSKSRRRRTSKLASCNFINATTHLHLLPLLLLLVHFALIMALPASGALVINVRPRHLHHEANNTISPHLEVQTPPPRAHPSDKSSSSSYLIVPSVARIKRAAQTGAQQVLPVGRSAKLVEVDALNYLHRYGYMNSSSAGANLISEDSFHEAIMQFQRFAGIPETGAVDAITQRFMQMPRCGNKDMSGKGENGKRRRRRRRRKKKKRRRRKRYALQGSKWRRQELTYRISQYPTRFLHKRHEVDGQIERAFRIWSQVAPIDFVVKKEGRVHIDIRFASGEHGDGDPFDGPGNTLAHAYFPQYGGDAHFDDQEYWTVDSYAGTNIFQVAAHELGHSLGLGHSSVREALMAPFYQKYKPNFKLHADDVLAIQALYGERNPAGSGAGGGADDEDTPLGGSTTTSTSTTTTTTESAPPARRRPPMSDDDGGSGSGSGSGFFGSSKPAVDLCQEPQIDTITRTEDGNTYVFRGAYYWQIKNDGLSGPAGKISRDWDGLPGDLDAALTWSDGKTFFFKGDKYWRFTNKRRAPGYPKQISAGFAGIPNNVDAAFVWGGNGKTYFIKRDKYWRFDSKQEPPVSGQYPKALKNWAGLPTSGLDAAFKWENGMTYFFKDELYWRFDDREFEVDTAARPAFPRSTAEWWFGCTNSNLPIRRRPSNNFDNKDKDKDKDKEKDEDNETSGSSLLLQGRKPPPPSASSSEESSLTRSILNSLSSLFPSSSANSASSSAGLVARSRETATNSAAADSPGEWSFHRGLGEEARRLPAAAAVNHELSGRHDTSRWSFPMGSLVGGSSMVARGEQSLSELKLVKPEAREDGRDESLHNVDSLEEAKANVALARATESSSVNVGQQQARTTANATS